jgi:hypothetical protein
MRECTPTVSLPGFFDVYRHSLELYLKAILILGNQLLAITGEAIPEPEIKAVLDRHRLTPFVPHLKKILDTSGAEWHFQDAPEIQTLAHAVRTRLRRARAFS